MKFISILQGLYQSFYSKAFYQRVAREWEKAIFAYVLVIVLIGSTVIGIEMAVGLHAFKPAFDDLVSQVPVIHFVNGRAKAEGPQPLTLKMRYKGKETPVILIDTGDTIKAPETTGATMVLTSHEFITLQKGEKRIRSLSSIKDLTVDAAWTREKTQWLFKLSLAVSIPLLLIFYYVSQLVIGVLYALAGLLWNIFFGSGLRFDALWRLALVASTPSAALTLMGHFIKPLAAIRFNSLLHILLTLSYLGFAVYANIPDENA